MTRSPGVISLILLLHLLTCSGELLPPQNLTVDLLDFQANIHWSCGQGNLPDTRFTVELQDRGLYGLWIPIKNCTLMTSTRCHFIFPKDINELMKPYFLKIVVTRESERTEMEYPRSFQPYGDSIISAPNLKVSIQNQSIYAEMRHHLKSVLSELNYSINLTKITQDESILVISTTAVSPWMFPTMQLSPGKYCVSSSVIHKQQMQMHHQSKQCIEMPEPESTVHYLLVVVPCLLVGPLLVLIVVVIFWYTRPSPAECAMPVFLDPTGIKSVATSIMSPTEVVPQSILLHALPTSTGGSSMPLADNLSSPWDYTSREKSLCQSDISVSLLSSEAKGLTESKSPSLESLSLYRQAQDDDLSWDLEGAPHSPELLLDKLEGDAVSQTHWLLPLDVPLDSLVRGFGDTQCDKTLEGHPSEGSDDESGLLDKPLPTELCSCTETELHSPFLSSPSGYEARDPVIPISSSLVSPGKQLTD